MNQRSPLIPMEVEAHYLETKSPNVSPAATANWNSFEHWRSLGENFRPRHQ